MKHQDDAIPPSLEEIYALGRIPRLHGLVRNSENVRQSSRSPRIECFRLKKDVNFPNHFHLAQYPLLVSKLPTLDNTTPRHL